MLDFMGELRQMAWRAINSCLTCDTQRIFWEGYRQSLDEVDKFVVATRAPVGEIASQPSPQ